MSILCNEVTFGCVWIASGWEVVARHQEGHQERGEGVEIEFTPMSDDVINYAYVINPQ